MHPLPWPEIPPTSDRSGVGRRRSSSGTFILILDFSVLSPHQQIWDILVTMAAGFSVFCPPSLIRLDVISCLLGRLRGLNYQGGVYPPTPERLASSTSAICVGNLLNKKFKCFVSDEERLRIARKLYEDWERGRHDDPLLYPVYRPARRRGRIKTKQRINPCSAVKKRPRIWEYAALTGKPVVIHERGNRILLSPVSVKGGKRELLNNLKTLAEVGRREIGADYTCLIDYGSGIITCTDSDLAQGWVNKICSAKVEAPSRIPKLLPDCSNMSKVLAKAKALYILHRDKYKDVYSALPDAAKRMKRSFRLPSRQEFRYLMEVCKLR